MTRARFGPVVAIAVLVALFVLPGLSALAGTDHSDPDAVAVVPLAGPNNVSYTSSVDGFSLSFLEYLPSGYAGASAPMVVYLPGLGTSTTNVSGGVGASTVPVQLINNASNFGFILISLNTRSSAGYYLNTPCGGPQRQDVLDAITVEETRRTIGSVYFAGFSGGTAGLLSIIGNHQVANVKGAVTSATITDMASTLYYDVNNNSDMGHYNAFVRDECGQAPQWLIPSGQGGQTPNRAAAQLWTLSTFRYYPSNFSGVKLYLAAGGKDTEAPNNLTNFPLYSNLNSTLLGQFGKGGCAGFFGYSTPSFGEPIFNFTTSTAWDCGVSYLNLTSPQSFLFQFDAQAPHTNVQPYYAKVFQYWQGYLLGGIYSATFPTVTVLTPHVFSWENFPSIVNPGAVSCGTGAGANSAAINTPTGDGIFAFIGQATSTHWVTGITDTAGDSFKFVKNVSVAGVEKIELWVVNSTTGSSANVISAANNAAASDCLWVVAVAKDRTSAAYSFLGATSTATNTTGYDPYTTTTGRNLVLTYVESPAANVYSGVYESTKVLNQRNVSTTLSAGGAETNATFPTSSLPQVTLGTSANWLALSVAIQRQPVPAAPTGLTVSKIGLTAFNFSFTGAGGGGILNYSLLIGTNGTVSGFPGQNCGDTWVVSLGTGVAYRFNVTVGSFFVIPSGAKICLRVFAWNATGQGTISAWDNFTMNGTLQSGGGGGGTGGGLGGFAQLSAISQQEWLIILALIIAVVTLIIVVARD